MYRRKTGRKQAGFTLIELAVVMAIMAIMAIANVPNYMNQINERRANKTVVDTQAILDAARTYRTQTGIWPGNATCTNATAVLRATTPPMLAGVDDTNPYNSAISTGCTANTFNVVQNLISGWDAVVVNTLPGAELINAGASQVRSTIGIPGSESGLDAKLSRGYTGDPEMNRMRTTLLMGNNNINEVNALNAASVTATAVNAATVTATAVNATTMSAGTLSATQMYGSAANVTTVTATNVNTTNMTAWGNTVTYGKITGAQAEITGRLAVSEFVEIKTASAEGTWCGSNSLISRNTSGQILNCINGTWAKPVTWYPGTVSGGGGCGSFPSGSMAFDASGKLFVCK